MQPSSTAPDADENTSLGRVSGLERGGFMRFSRVDKWYQCYRYILCWVGLHPWKKVSYRRKDRMLLVWEECIICQKPRGNPSDEE